MNARMSLPPLLREHGFAKHTGIHSGGVRKRQFYNKGMAFAEIAFYNLQDESNHFDNGFYYYDFFNSVDSYNGYPLPDAYYQIRFGLEY